MRISLIMVFAMFGLFLTFAIYGIITFDLSIKEMKTLLETRNEGFAFNMMQDLDKTIEKRFNDFKEFTRTHEVQDALKDSNEKFSKSEFGSTFQNRSVTNVMDDSYLVPFIQGMTDMELTRELEDKIQFYNNEYGYNVVEEMFVTNEFGANVASGSGISDYRQDDEAWWQTTKKDGIFIGNLQFQEEYGHYAIELDIRINDEAGNFLGVLRVILTLEDMIHDFINDAEIIHLPTRNGILADNQGRVIYSNGIQDFSNSDILPYFDKIFEGKDVGTIELSSTSDESKMISFAKSTGYNTFAGFGWITLIDQSSSSFVDEFIDLRNSILVTSIIGMISSVIIGIVVSFFIISPLKELSQLAESISQGKFMVKAKKSRINEMKVIGESFNKMSESLKKLIETEKKLAESQVKVKNERLAGIGEIAASLAHNLKNPLGTIKSSADIIERNSKGSNKEINEVISRMNRAIDRMLQQIEDVLNFARITPLVENLVSVKTLLNQALETIDLPENITVEIPKTDVSLICDSKKMEIVLINLIRNAIQSIGDNEGKIKIQNKEENGFFVLEIEDSGPGIQDELLTKIFGPLVTTKEKGTGLGLSTCKNIIEQHGGTISVKNNPTTFIIKIPLKNK